MSAYTRYAVDGVELGPVEIGLHLGALNAVLPCFTDRYVDPVHVTQDAFDHADAVVREFRRRTDTALGGPYRRFGNLERNREWFLDHADDQPEAARLLRQWGSGKHMDSPLEAREIRETFGVSDAAIRVLLEAGQVEAEALVEARLAA